MPCFIDVNIPIDDVVYLVNTDFPWIVYRINVKRIYSPNTGDVLEFYLSNPKLLRTEWEIENQIYIDSETHSVFIDTEEKIKTYCNTIYKKQQEQIDKLQKEVDELKSKLNKFRK